MSDGCVSPGKRSQPSNRLKLKKVGLTPRQVQRLEHHQHATGRTHRGGEAEVLREAIDAGLTAMGVPRMIEELCRGPQTPPSA